MNAIKDDAEGYIWALLQSGLLCDEFKSALALASSLYDNRFEFATELESLVVEFSLNGKVEILERIISKAVHDNLLKPHHHIISVCLMLERGLIRANDAVPLLSIHGNTNFDNISAKEYQELMDIVWLLRQDQKDGHLAPDQDDLMREAAKCLLRGYRERHSDVDIRVRFL